MSDGETVQQKRGGTVVPFPAARQQDARVSFDRDELREILNVYGRKVAAGEWRDYAIDFRKDKAVFAVYRRTSEMPLYRIEKDPKLARRQGAYSVVASSGLVMKRGQELGRVLKVLEGKELRLVD
ncbi:DUF2794 domain-containing protein [Salinarimonas sp.]|uniref:DUF2794 domain-containing protein n=1 Tax=Salinarimonas sp. TaxID=2766526 RepID=UPI0032D98EB9